MHTTVPSNIQLHPVLPRANSLYCYNDLDVVLSTLIFIYSQFARETSYYIVPCRTDCEGRNDSKREADRTKLLDDKEENHRCHNDHNCDGTDKTQTRRKQTTMGLDDDMESMLMKMEVRKCVKMTILSKNKD